METLSKVNEQKDNVLAPNTTLSLSETLGRGIKGGGGECRRTQVYKCEPSWVFVFLFRLFVSVLWMRGFLGCSRDC